MEKGEKERVRNWFKKPETWFSIFSLVVSLITFYYLQFYSGDISIYLSHDVSILYSPNSSMEFVIPAVLYNSGSPDTWKPVDVINVRAQGISDNETMFNWTDTQRFISGIDCQKELNISGVADCFVYESRKVPFVVQGKQTVTKLYHFRNSTPVHNTSASLNVTITFEVAKEKQFKLWGLLGLENIPYSSTKRYCFSEKAINDTIKNGSYQWGGEC